MHGAGVEDYHFYPCRADGVALGVEIERLGSDDDAYAQALALLDRSPIVDSITVWLGDKQIYFVVRPRPAPGPI